jgi:hypothetical protein
VRFASANEAPVQAPFLTRILSRPISLSNVMAGFAAALCVLANCSLQGQHVNPKYNETLADALHAGDFGIESCVLALLKSGGNTMAKKAMRDSCFAGHPVNIGRFVETEKCSLPGRWAKTNKTYAVFSS